MRSPPVPSVLLFLAFCLGGCEGNWAVSSAIAGAVNLGAVPVIHRTVFDAMWSTVTGRDCSIVRLDRNQSYCKPIEPPPEPPPYCTRSLAKVDCWQPAALPHPLPPEVADGPRTLTPEQEQDRTKRWPGL
jgi:hypothetical protein